MAAGKRVEIWDGDRLVAELAFPSPTKDDIVIGVADHSGRIWFGRQPQVGVLVKNHDVGSWFDSQESFVKWMDENPSDFARFFPGR